MCNVRSAGDHLYGKWLFTWLSLVMSLMVSYFVLSASRPKAALLFWFFDGFYKKDGYSIDVCDRLHAWLLIHTRLTTLLISLIARRQVGLQTE